MVVAYAQDLTRDVSSIAATTALAALAILLVGSALLAWWLTRARPDGRPFLHWFGGFASIALILSVTLFRDGGPGGFRPSAAFEWSQNGWQRLSTDPLASSQIVLNVLLFVVAGAMWTWITRKPVLVVAGLTVGSLLIECVQGVIGAGVPDIADLVANGFGGAMGAGSVVLLGTIFRPGSSTPTWRLRRSRVLYGIAALAVVAVAWLWGADARQRSVESELRERFSSISKAEVDGWLADPTGNSVNANLFSAISVQSDGNRSADGIIEVRYPASYFSLHRCVFVTWTETGVDFRRASGTDCTAFLG